MSKYNSKKIIVDSIQFDSIAESKYYEQLKWLKANKQIKDFIIQPSYLLQEGFKKNSKTYRKIEYKADFEVWHLDNSIEIIDIKGFITETAKLKFKLFEKRYPHKLTLLTHVKKFGGWIEIDEYKKLKRAEKKRAKQ